MVTRSKSSVCGRSPAGIVNLNSAGGMDVFVLRLSCDVLVEASATVQGSPTECGVPLSVIRCNRHPLHLQRVYKNQTKKIPKDISFNLLATGFFFFKF